MASVIIEMQTLTKPFHRAPCETLLENTKTPLNLSRNLLLSTPSATTQRQNSPRANSRFSLQLFAPVGKPAKKTLYPMHEAAKEAQTLGSSKT